MKDEFDFIRALRDRAPSSSSVTGIGDDAAVIHAGPGKDIVVTTDLLIEDVDFRRTTIPPYLLGHKALAVSLSDIAAMGARPRWSPGRSRRQSPMAACLPGWAAWSVGTPPRICSVRVAATYHCAR